MSNNRKSWSFLDTSVRQSFTWSLALTLLPVISAFAVSWVVARFAGPTAWGTVTWTMAFATALLIVAKLGLGLGASRLASEYGVQHPGKLRALFSTGFGLRIVITSVVAIVGFILAPTIAGWFHNASLEWPVRLGAGIVVCASIYEFQEHFLVGLNRHATVSRIRSLMLFLRVVLVVAAIALGWGAAAVLSSYIIAWVIALSVFAVLLYRYLPPSDTSSGGAMRGRLLALSIPLAISSASVTIYSQMDKLMIGYFDDVVEVGQYAVARAVTEVSLFPAFAAVMALRPALASRFTTGALEESAGLIRKSLRFSLVSCGLFASLFAVMAVPLFTTIYSDDYRYAGELMSVFVWVIALRSLGALLLPALIAAERARFYAILTTASAVINFALNLVLIPSMHAKGAIIATIISYSFLLLIGLKHAFSIFQVKLQMSGVLLTLRVVLAGLATAAITWFVVDRTTWTQSTWTTLGLAAVHAITYVFFVVILRVINANDLRTITRNTLKTKQ